MFMRLLFCSHLASGAGWIAIQQARAGLCPRGLIAAGHMPLSGADAADDCRMLDDDVEVCLFCFRAWDLGCDIQQLCLRVVGRGASCVLAHWRKAVAVVRLLSAWHVRIYFRLWRRVARSKPNLLQHKSLLVRPIETMDARLLRERWGRLSEWLAWFGGPSCLRWPYSVHWIARIPNLWPYSIGEWDNLECNTTPSQRLLLRITLADLLKVAAPDTPLRMGRVFATRRQPFQQTTAHKSGSVRISHLGLPWNPKRPTA